MKSLRRTGKLDGGASRDQMLIAPLEIGLVGQDRKAGGPAVAIGAGEGGRIEIGADQPFGRRGLLDLGDEAIAPRGYFAGQTVGETARRAGGTRGPFDLVKSGRSALRFSTSRRLSAQIRASVSLIRQRPDW